jgi:putative nucleotidyltransferase with HDIG domain
MPDEPLSGDKIWGAKGGVSWPGLADLRAMAVGVLFVALSSLILVVQIPENEGAQQIKVGDVAQRDVLAPHHITYISDVSTKAARDRAAVSVPQIYDPPDTRIARQQVGRARQIFDYFDSVRADTYASLDDKRGLIAAVTDLTLTDSVIGSMLAASDETWNTIKTEALSVLDQAMRAEVRSDGLSITRRRLPMLLHLEVSDQAATVAVAIAEDLIQPNTFVNEERTAEERRLASENVQPVTVTYEKNESVLRVGDLVRPEDIEALQELGLQQPAFELPDVIGTIGYVALIALVMGLYLVRFRPRALDKPRYQGLLLLLLLMFIGLARGMIPGHTLLPYLFPMAALSIMLAALIEVQLGVLATLLVGLIVGYIAGGSLELTIYSVMSGLVGIFSLGRVERVNRLLWSSVYVALMNVAIVLIFRVPTGDFDSVGLLQLMATAAANGALSASLTLIGFFLVGNLMGITTSLQLQDLARPTQPLLRQLLLRAPGTYHHSLMVSNLAEQAAERVGADALLARVGAYYHDIGKAVRPYFFVENQIEGVNVQDRLDPRTSAQIIISHVKDGLDLARSHRLPRDVRVFIPEHQGTGLIKYFYHQALEQGDNAAQVDEADFRYPGPKPQSKETGIVMLADSSEAAVRAERPTSVDEIDKIVRCVIADKLNSGELDECDLTMRDLDRCRAAFVEVLQGIFHPRTKYPGQAVEELAPANPVAALSPPQPASPALPAAESAPELEG